MYVFVIIVVVVVCSHYQLLLFLTLITSLQTILNRNKSFRRILIKLAWTTSKTSNRDSIKTLPFSFSLPQSVQSKKPRQRVNMAKIRMGHRMAAVISVNLFARSIFDLFGNFQLMPIFEP